MWIISYHQATLFFFFLATLFKNVIWLVKCTGTTKTVSGFYNIFIYISIRKLRFWLPRLSPTPITVLCFTGTWNLESSLRGFHKTLVSIEQWFSNHHKSPQGLIKIRTAGLYSWSFWFSSSRAGTKNLHF